MDRRLRVRLPLRRGAERPRHRRGSRRRPPGSPHSAPPSRPPTRCGKTARRSAPPAGLVEPGVYEAMVGGSPVPIPPPDYQQYVEQAAARARNWEHFRRFFRDHDCILSVTAQRTAAVHRMVGTGLDDRRSELPRRELRPDLLQSHHDLQLARLPRGLGARAASSTASPSVCRSPASPVAKTSSCASPQRSSRPPPGRNVPPTAEPRTRAGGPACRTGRRVRGYTSCHKSRSTLACGLSVG